MEGGSDGEEIQLVVVLKKRKHVSGDLNSGQGHQIAAQPDSNRRAERQASPCSGQSNDMYLPDLTHARKPIAAGSTGVQGMRNGAAGLTRVKKVDRQTPEGQRSRYGQQRAKGKTGTTHQIVRHKRTRLDLILPRTGIRAHGCKSEDHTSGSPCNLRCKCTVISAKAS